MTTATLDRPVGRDALADLRGSLDELHRKGYYFDPALGKLADQARRWDVRMADNTTLSTMSGGDVVRSTQKTTPKTSVVEIDLGGSGTEDLSAFPGAGANRMMKVEDAASADGDWLMGVAGVREDTPASLVSASSDYSALTLSKQGALWVVSAPPFAVQATSGGLTTATTAYSTGDQVATQFTISNAALASGGGGWIEAAWINDETAIIGNYRLWIFNASVTPASDNAAFSISDADSEKMACPYIEVGPAVSGGLNNNPVWTGSMSYICAATSLFVLLQTLSGHTFFGATTSLKLNLVLTRAPA